MPAFILCSVVIVHNEHSISAIWCEITHCLLHTFVKLFNKTRKIIITQLLLSYIFTRGK
jgi:hypothetical protein